jgi:hypothetical protein
VDRERELTCVFTVLKIVLLLSEGEDEGAIPR